VCESLANSHLSRPCVTVCFFFSSRRRHTRCYRDWSSDVCSSDLQAGEVLFKRDWQVKDTNCPDGDGLGPVFNATSCVACHNQGGDRKSTRLNSSHGSISYAVFCLKKKKTKKRQKRRRHKRTQQHT